MAKRIKVKGRTPPSSTRKKLVKEGSRKFIGPRTERSVSSEKYDRGIYAPSTMHHVERGTKKVRVPEENQVVREYGRYPYNPYLSTVPDGPQWGKGNIAKKKGLLELLLKRQEAKRGATRPSSTRKKRVKEGNPRFIGPRTLESEVAEDAATKFRESFGPSRAGEPTPAYVMRNVGKKGNLPRISKPKKKTASGTNSRIKTLIALKRLSESGQLPGEVGRMLRDIPEI